MKEEKTQKSRVLAWLIFGTVLYGLLFIFLSAHTKVCDLSGVSISLDNLTAWKPLTIYTGCKSINELGDALAGAFAPIAFLWLVGAVLIQSKELEAQREELSSTRSVMEQQVAEMRSSTKLLAAQTAALQDEQRRRDEEHADREFDAILETIQPWLNENGGLDIHFDQLTVSHDKDGKQITTSTNASHYPVLLVGDQPPFYGAASIENIRKIKSAARNLSEADPITIIIRENSIAAAESFSKKISALLDAQSKISAAKRFATIEFNLVDFSAAMTQLYQTIQRLVEGRQWEKIDDL